MYISELKLQGFKSFANQTELTFDNGITVIVGPNGCGKSNIVDSLRWVLGEQRPSSLRSASMENIIFNGAGKKKALGMAEVMLTFVNNRGLLPMEYNEVTIGRRLYRSGESEYLINGTSCRLRDIMELFMDTGMSSDAYSVIQLNMVEEILSNKNHDRRRLFEEAAGITSYKEKRKKTLRKLDATQEDLQRVEDIVSEIRKSVRRLERQAKKAQKAQQYRKELILLDQGLSRHNYLKFQGELDPIKERIVNAEKEKSKMLASAEELEDSLKTAQASLREKEQEEAEARRRFRQLANILKEAETEVQISDEKVKTGRNLVEQYTGDIKQAGEDLEELREIVSQTEKELSGFTAELDKAEKNLSDSQKTYSSVQKKYNEEQQALEELKKAHSEAGHERNKLESKRIKIRSRQENISEELERIGTERIQLEAKITGLQTEGTQIKQGLESGQQELEQQKNNLQQAQEQREQLSTRQNELKDQIRKKESSRDSLQSEKELLQEIARSNETFPSSVNYLLQNHTNKFSCIGPVSKLFSTDEDHAVALEAVLGPALNYIVVETMDDAQQAGTLLKKEGKGSVTLIPLDQLSDHYQTHKEALSHAVETPAKLQAVKELLLGQVVMVDSIENGTGYSNESLTVVTREGQVITDKRFVQIGSIGKNAGMRVGLKDKINKLDAKLLQATRNIDKKQKELNKAQEAFQKIGLQQLREKLEGCRKNIREKENAYNTGQSKMQVYRANIEELANRKQALESTGKSTEGDYAELKPLREKLDATLMELEKEQAQKETVLRKLEGERSIAQERFQKAQLKRQNLRNEVENHERDLQRAKEGIESLSSRTEKREEKKEEVKARIKTNESHIRALKGKIKEVGEKKQTAELKLKDVSEISAEQRGVIKKIEDELKEIRRQKEVNMELEHHLSMAREKLEMQAINVSDHVWETYELLIEQIEAVLPDDKNPDVAKERISWLRQKLNRMGEVNELAVEEYEEKKERLDFYDEQIEDLTNARRELEQTIREINRTATERFNKTFEEIRTNFQDVFHTLFNEDDYCDLIIEDDAEDQLEARIQIKANPRGKQPSSIHQLSTGEKTLTAIALLFAIYLVKPSPFCVLDEVDAPLDDANITQFTRMIKRFSKDTQFIIITHNKKTMSRAEMIYGVTMPETGVSQLVGVEMEEAMQEAQ